VKWGAKNIERESWECLPRVRVRRARWEAACAGAEGPEMLLWNTW